MNRREVLGNITILVGGALVSTTGLLQSCKMTDKKRTALTAADIPLMDEIGETIIPTTATSPGAKAAQIGAYMLVTVNDCYNEKQKNIFIEGLNTFDLTCEKKYSKGFMELTSVQKKEFLKQLDVEAKAEKNNMNRKKENSPAQCFSMLKQLTVSGYFTSKIGMTKALRYEAVPGRYEGCTSYKAGDKPWA